MHLPFACSYIIRVCITYCSICRTQFESITPKHSRLIRKLMSSNFLPVNNVQAFILRYETCIAINCYLPQKLSGWKFVQWKFSECNLKWCKRERNIGEKFLMWNLLLTFLVDLVVFCVSFQFICCSETIKLILLVEICHLWIQ